MKVSLKIQNIERKLELLRLFWLESKVSKQNIYIIRIIMQKKSAKGK